MRSSSTVRPCDKYGLEQHPGTDNAILVALNELEIDVSKHRINISDNIFLRWLIDEQSLLSVILCGIFWDFLDFIPVTESIRLTVFSYGFPKEHRSIIQHFVRTDFSRPEGQAFQQGSLLLSANETVEAGVLATPSLCFCRILFVYDHLPTLSETNPGTVSDCSLCIRLWRLGYIPVAQHLSLE